MKTVSKNLTNLKNARVAIINKLNEVQGTSIPTETTLSELPRYIEGGSMGIVDFDTWNYTNLTLSDFKFNPDKTMYYATIRIPRDGFLAAEFAVTVHIDRWISILVKPKGANDDPKNWIKVSSDVSTMLASGWEKSRTCTSFHSFVKKGNTLAFSSNSSWDFKFWFSNITLFYK